MTNLTVIIPHYNGKHYLKECLDSIKNQGISLEVIIVDNGSQDRSQEYIKESYSEFTLIENRENLGFAVAVNQGINASKGDYIFLLNNDVKLGPKCIDNLIKCLEEDEKIFSAASCMMQYEDKSKLDDAGDEYNLLGWTKKAGEGKSPQKYPEKRDIFSSCAGAALYRRSILEEIRCFDEKFFAYMEDVDLGYRARIQGYRNVYCPEAVVYHHGSRTTGSRYNQFKIRLAARNNIYVPYKNMPWPQLLLNSHFLILGFLTKYLFFSKKKQGKYYLEGVKEGLNSLDKIQKVRYQRENLVNYLKIEWTLIKNTLKFPFI